MLSFVYRSAKKEEMYLYLAKRDDFSPVPKALIELFGEPKLVLQVNLTNRSNLARENINTVLTDLKEKGYFLQMPPKVRSLLKSDDDV